MSGPQLVAMSILAGVIVLAVVAPLCWAVDRMSEAALPPAKPGKWFMSYHAAWTAAHPGAWERGEEQGGGFYKGDVWGSSTLDWDREWFRSRGMGMPRRTIHVTPKPPGPNEFRIGTLGPGESVSFPIRIEGDK